MTTPTSPILPAVLRTPQAAQYLGLGVPTLEKMRMKGTPTSPPFVRMGKRAIGYMRTDLDEWLQASRRGSTSEPTAIE